MRQREREREREIFVTSDIVVTILPASALLSRQKFTGYKINIKIA